MEASVNREDILKMKAGREMDALVAEKVMGWHFVKDEEVWPLEAEGMWLDKDNRFLCNTFEPSINIADAWDVHKTMCSKRFTGRTKYLMYIQYVVSARFDNGKNIIAWPGVLAHIEPEDFCRAALLAVMEVK
jgi:hypothetical protein